MTRNNRHFFDGPLDGSGTCAACGKPYETKDERHDYGKLFKIDPANPTAPPSIRPFVAADEVRERAEIAAQDAMLGPAAAERLARARAEFARGEFVDAADLDAAINARRKGAKAKS